MNEVELAAGSVFRNTILDKFVFSRNLNPNQAEIMFNSATKAFMSESCVALSLGLCGKRADLLGTYIIKLLLDIGLLPNDNAFAVIARLIEISVTNPDIDISNCIECFAQQHEATVSAVEHIIEKSFNVYDTSFMQMVTRHTKSNPLTSKDVLCDIAVFVRFNYLMGLRRNE